MISNANDDTAGTFVFRLVKWCVRGGSIEV